MKFLKFLGSTLGRVCFSIIFLMAGVKKIFSWGLVKADIGTMLAKWDSYQPSGFIGWMVNLIGNYVAIFLVLAIILEIIGGLFILSGIKPRIGAFLLLIFMIPTTLFMHPFWIYGVNLGEMQFIMFFKNLSMIGALFFIWVYDNGYYQPKKPALDAERGQGDLFHHESFADDHREEHE